MKSFWKNCCTTLDFIFYYHLNAGKSRSLESGDLTGDQRIEIQDIQRLILFSELGSVYEMTDDGLYFDKFGRFSKKWYHEENAKKYFTKRMQILLEDRNHLKSEKKENYFILFLTKIFNMIAPIIDTQNNYTTWSRNKIQNNVNNVTNYRKNYNNTLLDWNNGSVLGIILDRNIAKYLKEEEEYLKLKKSLQKLLYLSFESNFNYWDCFRKDSTIFNNILCLNIKLNKDIDLTDIEFTNVRYLIISSKGFNYMNIDYSADEEENAMINLLQKKYFPKLNHLVLEGEHVSILLRKCDVFENLEKLEIRGMSDYDFKNEIFYTLKGLLPYCPCLKFSIIPQYLLVQNPHHGSVSFEGVKDIYNLKDKNCVFSIQNESYDYYYERCWE